MKLKCAFLSFDKNAGSFLHTMSFIYVKCLATVRALRFLAYSSAVRLFFRKMKSKTCCFTGHRKIPKGELPQIKTKLKNTITELIGNGIIYYGAGGALGFDILAALTVLELKQQYPQIKLILVLPCKNQTRNWRQNDIDIYDDIKQKADKVVYTSELYYNGCMQKRNRHLVDNSGYCICYKTHDTGGTAFTVNYANKQRLKIINIA